MNSRTPQWSIIIPALNEERVIGQCLDSLCSLDYPLESVEVVVADNGSTDRTVEIVRSFADRLQITVVEVPKVPVGAARNAAVRASTGRLLAFLDSDCLARPDWLQQADCVASSNRGHVFGSYYGLPADAGWPARVWRQRFHEDRTGSVSYLPGGNLMMERATFDRVGGFDPFLRSNEDSQLCSRAKAAGSDVRVFPELATIHLGAEKDWMHFVRRQRWHGSNVISREALRGNLKAIGLAAFTILCFVLAIVLALVGAFSAAAIALAAILIPPTLMAVATSRRPKRLLDLPPLIALLLTYALVRAWVLPTAILRGIQRWSLAPNPEAKPRCI